MGVERFRFAVVLMFLVSFHVHVSRSTEARPLLIAKENSKSNNTRTLSFFLPKDSSERVI